MCGISHLIRSYIYIEHKALQHAIVKRGSERVLETHAIHVHVGMYVRFFFMSLHA